MWVQLIEGAIWVRIIQGALRVPVLGLAVVALGPCEVATDVLARVVDPLRWLIRDLSPIDRVAGAGVYHSSMTSDRAHQQRCEKILQQTFHSPSGRVGRLGCRAGYFVEEWRTSNRVVSVLCWQAL